MTPPKITSAPVSSAPLTCEERSAPDEPRTSTQMGSVPSVELTYPEPSHPSLGKLSLIPEAQVRSRFDPTRYGLPADWQPAVVTPESIGKITGSENVFNTPEVFFDHPPWLKALIYFLNQIKRGDLDMYHVPVNQGTNMRRFSEYAPKDKELRAPNLDVQTGTTAYVRGEIRPVQGQPDSLITRWVIRYDKPLLHESGLHIKGFSAAAAPHVEYDSSFSDWQAIKDISGGDLDYENPQHTGAPLTTPWNYVAPPLPEGHRDWMIAFNPVVDSIEASVKAAAAFGEVDFLTDIPFLGLFMKGPIDSGRGKLYLWAFNPTVGITPYFNRTVCKEYRNQKTPEKDLPVHCKIRPNTMPRKAGDLLDFFSPLFDGYRGGLLKHMAPYYNPNSEYIAPFVEKGEKLLQWAQQKTGRAHAQPQQACEELAGRWKQDRCLLPQPKKYGDILTVNERREAECRELKSAGNPEQCERPIGRQQIPRQSSAVDRINQELQFFGLPPIGRRRGTIIDWANTDLMQDTDRLKAMKHAPYTVLHLQMNPGRLPLPIGELQVDDKTDIKVEYFTRPVQVPDLEKPGQTKWEAQTGLRVSVQPLRLTHTDLHATGYHVKADVLEAEKMEVEIPNILGMDETQPQTRSPLTVQISGARAKGLHLTDQNGDVDIAMQRATLKELNFRFEHPSLLFGSEADKKNERLARLGKNQGRDCSDPTNPCHEPQWRTTFKGLEGDGLKVGVPQIQGLDVAKFSIPVIEVTQRFKTQEESTVSDILVVEIPTLQSKGSMDLDLKAKDGEPNKGTVVHLEGDSMLKNIRLTSEFKGDHSLLKGSFDLSGTIEKATLTHDPLASVTFTTKTNGHPVKPLSGHIDLEINNPAKQPYQKEAPKGPPPKFDLDLDLPYVGFESQGAFTMAPGSATLRNGKVKLHGETKVTGSMEGAIDLKEASYHHHKQKGLELGRLDLFPNLEGIHSRGNFKLEILEDGIRLSNPKDPQQEPLSLGLSLSETNLHHCPDLSHSSYAHKVEAEAIETNFRFSKGQVEIQDLREFEFRNVTVKGETQPRLTRFKSGPISIGRIEGGGAVWVNSLLFGFVRLSFPVLGGIPSAQDTHLPDARALTSHLPEEHKKKLRQDLAGGDFLYVGGIKFERNEKGWMAGARDVILNFHEVGNLNQYVMLRVPQLTFGMLGDKLIFPPLSNYLANTYVNIPSRGGLTHMGSPDRWREALKKEKE